MPDARVVKIGQQLVYSAPASGTARVTKVGLQVVYPSSQAGGAVGAPSPDWMWLHTRATGGLTVEPMDGPAAPLSASWDAGRGSMTDSYGGLLTEAPGWAAWWRLSEPPSGDYGGIGSGDIVVSHRFHFHPGFQGVSSPTPAQETHFVWQWGGGNIATNPSRAGLSYVPMPDWSFYGMSVSADGLVCLWRKRHDLERERMKSASLSEPLQAGVWYVMEFQVVDDLLIGRRALRGSVWREDRTRPADWTVAWDDSSAQRLRRPKPNYCGMLHLRGTGAYTVAPGWHVADWKTRPVTSSAASGITFSQPPTNTFIDVPMVPQPVVSVLNAYGEPEPSYAKNVRISLCDASGNLITGTGTALLTGATRVAALSGRASFSGVAVAASGTYRLRADADPYPNALSCTSGTFAVTQMGGGGTTGQGSVAFSGVPASGTAGVSLAPFNVLVKLEDGSTDAAYNDYVDVSVASGPTGARITGGRLTAHNGTARFTNAILAPGGTYTLRASAGTKTPAVSGSISVTEPAYQYTDPTICSAWLVPRGVPYDGHFPQCSPDSKRWRIDDTCLVIPPTQCEISDNPVYNTNKLLSLSRIETVEVLDEGMRRTPQKLITIAWPRMGRELYDVLDAKRRFGLAFRMEFGGVRDGDMEEAFTPESGTEALYVYYGLERCWRSGSVKVYANGSEVTSGFTVDHEGGRITFSQKRAASDVVRVSYVWRPRLEVVSLSENMSPTQGSDFRVLLTATLREVNW